jgi:hypothetical protein
MAKTRKLSRASLDYRDRHRLCSYRPALLYVPSLGEMPRICTQMLTYENKDTLEVPAAHTLARPDMRNLTLYKEAVTAPDAQNEGIVIARSENHSPCPTDWYYTERSMSRPLARYSVI